MALPATITITQSGLAPRVIIADGAVPPPPLGLPPYPLTNDPTETWYLTWSNGALTWVQVNNAAPLTVTAPASGTAGVTMAITGTVVPPGDTVVFALGLSSTIQPAGEYVASSNVQGALSATLTPPGPGTYYAWAMDVTKGTFAVSGPITVAASSPVLSFSTPGTASYSLASGGTIWVDGEIEPGQNLALQVAFSESNSSPPVTGWCPAYVTGLGYHWGAEMPMPGATGTYYVWLETTDGTHVVLSAFTITITA